jgi:hypothetical protein
LLLRSVTYCCFRIYRAFSTPRFTESHLPLIEGASCGSPAPPRLLAGTPERLRENALELLAENGTVR